MLLRVLSAFLSHVTSGTICLTGFFCLLNCLFLHKVLGTGLLSLAVSMLEVEELATVVEVVSVVVEGEA